MRRTPRLDPGIPSYEYSFSCAPEFSKTSSTPSPPNSPRPKFKSLSKAKFNTDSTPPPFTEAQPQHESAGKVVRAFALASQKREAKTHELGLLFDSVVPVLDEVRRAAKILNVALGEDGGNGEVRISDKIAGKSNEVKEATDEFHACSKALIQNARGGESADAHREEIRKLEALLVQEKIKLREEMVAIAQREAAVVWRERAASRRELSASKKIGFLARASMKSRGAITKPQTATPHLQTSNKSASKVEENKEKEEEELILREG